VARGLRRAEASGREHPPGRHHGFRGSQEQIQIISIAIGRPIPKVPAIVIANAASKFASA
jgi:hypothetical protein